MSAIADSMEKNGLPESAEYIRNKLDHDIKLCMVDICKVSTIEFLFYELFLTMHDDGYSADVIRRAVGSCCGNMATSTC